jgi:L-rhamnose mutarotase
MGSARRIASVIRLRPEHEQAYRQLHAAAWPDVLAALSRAHVRNYSIFLRDGLLFSYLEYTGDDYATDMAAIAADGATRRWWQLTDQCQQPLESGDEGAIDAHHHIWDLGVRDQPWTTGLAPLRRSFSIADLRPALERNNVTATVLVQTITGYEETPELLALAAAQPLVAGVSRLDPDRFPRIADRLAALRSLPGGDALVGIRHQASG